MKKLDFSVIAKNNTSIVLTNIFITDYLAFAPGDFVKVYIYCLYECGRNNENWHEDLKANSQLDDTTILNAFKYWEEVGLVQILNEDELEIVFNEVKETKGRIKYSRGKYAEFNKQIKPLFQNRELTPLELNEYYSIMEEFSIQPEALVMIIKYCMDKADDKNINRKYVLNVARAWATDGIVSVEQVEKKLADQTKLSKNIGRIFKALSLQKDIIQQDIDLFNKWVAEFNFSTSYIIEAIKHARDIKSLRRLDEVLGELYSQNILTTPELENYFGTKNQLKELAININKNLSYFDSNIDNVIETYIKPWRSMGYSDTSLILISKYCYKNAQKSLYSMNKYIEHLYNAGKIENQDIIAYMQRTKALEQELKDLLQKNGIVLYVDDKYISLYNTWKNVWNFTPELIDYAMSITHERGVTEHVMGYIAGILSNWKNAIIYDLESAKNYKKQAGVNDDIKTEAFAGDAYSHLFSDFDLSELD